ncbi:methyltransferase (TIGR00027 family) [Lipingzhangella halophila]|uniref:S-adenosyl-L-methionine-dependent methyltransferase n=1 Tax=Lipingzhangella halophila TaxID=1783352 RepID=A0A7W7RCX8_9ACTN|nr:SAM-dependent methyltransferase [Lipingzhangella halophila]MBB4929673.1 methyltransferase (TIGR00027 family) [Lipingzhangella halophila]
MASQPDLPEQLTGVGATALGVALLRAQESRRADRLFDDPYAQHFLDAVDPAASPWAAASASTEQGFLHLVAEQVAVRTRFLDQTLLEAAQAGCGQVVVLACGVDTRSYRLDWPAGTQIFDVDFADVLAFRNAVLAQRGAAVPGNRISVATDLREDWPHAVTEAGLDPRQPTAWLAEGLLYALPPAAADLLLDRITATSAPGSILALDHAEDSELLRAARGELSAELVDLWQGGPTDDLTTWLTRYGWRPTVRDIAEVAARYQRPTPAAFDPERDGTGRGWLATAHLPQQL